MRRVLLLASAIVFVDTMFFAALTPLLPHFVHRFALSKVGAGFLAASYPVGVLVGSVPGGLLAARIGVKAAAVAGLMLVAATSVTFGFADSIVVLDGARLAQGIGSAVRVDSRLELAGRYRARRPWAPTPRIRPASESSLLPVAVPAEDDSATPRLTGVALIRTVPRHAFIQPPEAAASQTRSATKPISIIRSPGRNRGAPPSNPAEHPPDLDRAADHIHDGRRDCA